MAFPEGDTPLDFEPSLDERAGGRGPARWLRGDQGPLLGWRRTVGGVIVGLVGVGVVTGLHLLGLSPRLFLPGLLYLLAVFTASMTGGLWPGLITSLLAVLAFDAYYVPPSGSLIPDDIQLAGGETISGIFILGVFFAIALIVTLMAHRVLADRVRVRKEEERLAFLLEASEAVAASLDFSTALSHVVRVSVPALGDWSAVYTPSNGSVEELDLSDPLPPAIRELRRRRPIDPEDPVGVGKVIRTGTPEFHPRPSRLLLQTLGEEDPRFRFLRRDRLRSYLAVPIRAQGRIAGVVAVATGSSRRRLGKREFALLLDLARRASSALENAALYQERDHLARTLQTGLLPTSIPPIPGVQLAPRYRPLGTGSEVGGDFYDAFPTGRSEWGIVVGDVAGKGPEAAVLTGIVRHTIRTLARQVPAGPGLMLAALNDRLVNEEAVDRFVTICYVTIRPHSEGIEVAIATGGHPPPMLCRIDGSVERVGGHGSILGLLPDPVITEVPIHMGLGDTLVLYSDGLTDAIDRAALPERVLKDLLQGCAGLEADTVADRLDGAARLASGVPPRDDVCLVVVRSTGVADGLRPKNRAMSA